MPNAMVGEDFELFTGTSTSSGATAILTGNVTRYNYFQLSSTIGVYEVLASVAVSSLVTATAETTTLMSTAVVALDDLGSTAKDVRVLVTAANRLYSFEGRFGKVLVRQNGSTNGTAYLTASIKPTR